MKKMSILAILCAIVPLAACHVFLGPEPDISHWGIFDRIWTDFNETYALFDARDVDWDEVRKTYYPQITPGMGNFEFFRLCAEMLDELNDPHVYLTAPFGNSFSLDVGSSEGEPFNLDIIRREYLENGGSFAGGRKFLYGTARPDKSSRRIGYIYIRDFSGNFEIGLDPIQSWAKEIDSIVKQLQDTDALVLDVRNNSGGLGPNMHYIAGRFVSVPRNYIQISTKNGPGRSDFSSPVTFFVRPAARRYTKPIALLTNGGTISAAEWFTMALLTQSHVIHAGTETRGAFSARIVRPLANGWSYTLSIQRATGMDGRNLEGSGLMPYAEHIIENEPSFDTDRQLEYALSLF